MSLRPHKNDLKKHALTPKHKKNANAVHGQSALKGYGMILTLFYFYDLRKYLFILVTRFL